MNKKVEELIKKKVEEKGFSFLGIKLGKSRGERTLEITIDSPGGVSIEDCALVSQSIEALLDENDPIKEKYLLVVSSPGTS